MAIFRETYKLSGKIVILRNAEPEDAAALIALVQQVDTETTFLSREPGEFSMTEADERTFIQSQKDMPNARLVVAEIDGRIVAFSGAFFHTTSRYRHAGEVTLAVLAAHWGMGIGQALLAEHIAWCKQNNVKKINLTVDTQNLRAISLYHRLGFVVEGRQSRERRLADGTYRESYWMGLAL